MNSRRRFAALAVLSPALLIAAMALAMTFRSDTGQACIRVPGLDGPLACRQVTDAAMNEVAGRGCGRHDCEVDLGRGLLLYHEGRDLFRPDVQRRLEACLAETGLTARVLAVQPNPQPPVPTPRGLVQIWPDRVTAAIAIADLRTNLAANRAVDALARARAGDSPAVRLDPQARTLTVTYNKRELALLNLEYAIATAGYQANGTPARLGGTDAPPRGWTAISLAGPPAAP